MRPPRRGSEGEVSHSLGRICPETRARTRGLFAPSPQVGKRGSGRIEAPAEAPSRRAWPLVLTSARPFASELPALRRRFEQRHKDCLDVSAFVNGSAAQLLSQLATDFLR